MQTEVAGTGKSGPSRRDLHTNINYADEEAYAKQLEPLGGKEDMWQGGDIFYPNPPKQAVPSVVEDVSGRESQFSLWKNGFMYAKQHTSVMLKTEDLADNEKILKEYYPEMEQWLKDVTGAPRAFVFHHAVRVTDSRHHVNGLKKDDIGKKFLPQAAVLAAHLDQSSWQACQVLHNKFPDEAEALLHGRVMIVNAWRPIKPVYRHPFGIADASTVPHSDLVVRPNRWFKEIRESMGIRPSSGHRWYYKFAQQPEDVLIFKQSDNHGPARACPHTAFVDKEYESADARESIEIRAFLLWPDHESVLHEPKL